MKRLLFGIVLVVALMFGGCIPLASDIQSVGTQTLLVSEQIDALQDGVASMKDEFEKNKLISAETAASIEKVSEEIDRIQPTLVDVATAVKEADYVDGDTFGNAITGLKAANTASAPLNPYAVPIGAGLSLVGAFLEVMRRKEKNEKAKVQAKYQAHKQGVEKTMKEVSASSDSSVAAIEAQLFGNIGDARADLGVV